MARKCKILIADDSKLLRKQLREELEALDCEVIETESLSDRPDGVILDIVMPEINGIEVLRVIKELDDTIPVIMLSSAGTPEKLMETLKLGALDFIQKPYTPEQIEKAIARIRKKAGLDEQ